MSVKISFTGRNSQIGEYFKGEYDYVSYDLMDPNTWKPLLESDVVFLLLPKSKNTLDMAKRFVLSAKRSRIRHIIKIGSLGPWRLIHKQLDAFMREAKVPYTSFDIAPMMNNIFTEQYKASERTLLDYRGNSPAPYLDPVCLASAIEQCLDRDEHKNRNYQCTGGIQYTIQQVKDIMCTKGYPVDIINDTTNNNIHKMTDSTSDFILMRHIAELYKSEGWHPAISKDLPRYFNANSRTLEEFIDEDKNIFSRRFIDDNCL
jgi:hypothetical protein